MTFAPLDFTPTILGLLALSSIALGQMSINSMVRVFAETANKAQEEKKTYSENLEKAEGDNIFKYILLINVAALEGYVAQTRIQAEQSFRLTKIVALIGFVMLGVGIVLAIYLSTLGRSTLEAAYLAAIAGVLTEFISGVFFYLYNRTLHQINRFHDNLVAMQQMSMAYLATGLVSDRRTGDEARLDLAKRTIVPIGPADAGQSHYDSPEST